jgi:tetratricopeptide (TPR) repeat protein
MGLEGYNIPIFNVQHFLMKPLNVILATCLFSSTGIAQTLQQAITKTENERFEAAATEYRALITKEPGKGEYYFYFGENYFQNDDADSARMQFEKGISTNPTNALNYVGLGKVLLAKGDVNGAKTQFYKATSISANKSAEVMREIAEAWIVTPNKNADEALNMANAAIKLDPKHPEGYIELGDAQLEKNPTDGSAPIKSYKKATELNPKSPKGLLREGKLYQRGRNYQLALDYYKRAIELDPTFAPAYRELAELYFLAAQPARSIENWKKYLELNNSDYARYRFMSALVYNKQYADAIAEYESLKKSGFENVYLERLAAYSYAEMGDKKDTMAYPKGLVAINRFFEKAGASFKYRADDYKYKGILLARTGSDSLGLIEMEKAIALDPASAGDMYSEMAKVSSRAKKHEQAAGYLEKKKKGDFKNLNNNDCFELGKAYYSMGVARLKEASEMKEALQKKKKPMTPEATAKAEEAKNYFLRADSSFRVLTQLNANWPVGYAWRGRANSLSDPEATLDSTKVHYEKLLTAVKPEERTGTYKNYVIEAHEYLGYYYVKHKDDAKAKEQWLIVKELDPNNEKQKLFFNPPKPKPQTKQ